MVHSITQTKIQCALICILGRGYEYIYKASVVGGEIVVDGTGCPKAYTASFLVSDVFR